MAFLSFPAARVRALSARNSIKALARAIIASVLPLPRWLFLVIDLTLKVTERKNERDTEGGSEREREHGENGKVLRIPRRQEIDSLSPAVRLRYGVTHMGCRFLEVGQKYPLDMYMKWI